MAPLAWSSGFVATAGAESPARLRASRVIDADVHSLRLWFLKAMTAHLTTLTRAWAWVIVRLSWLKLTGLAVEAGLFPKVLCCEYDL